MKLNNKLNDAVHAVLHLAYVDQPLTSETLAEAVQTNPVVIRRLMAGLRERRWVTSDKGHGGGWRLTCDLADLTLYDVYVAVYSPTLLAVGARTRTSTVECQIEQAVNAATEPVLREAEDHIVHGFKAVTLHAIYENVVQQQGGHRGTNHPTA